jgi:hypothetical protein
LDAERLITCACAGQAARGATTCYKPSKVFGLRRFAIGLCTVALAISQAVAGESQAAAAAGSWSWAAAADQTVLVGAPRGEARPGRLADPPPQGRLAWLLPAVAPGLVPPATFPLLFAVRLSDAAPALVAGGRSTRGPPVADAT